MRKTVRATFVTGHILVGITNLAAQPAPTLTADGASRDVRIVKRALTELHPPLTKYRSQAEIDAAFTRFETRGNAARPPAEMYLAATELAGAIRCGHTWTNFPNQSRKVRIAIDDAADKLPFTMGLVENRWLVLANADPAHIARDIAIAEDIPLFSMGSNVEQNCRKPIAAGFR